MRVAGTIILLGCAWSACERPPLPGYHKLGDGAWYKRITLGDGERSPNDSDQVQLRVRCARPDAGPGSFFSADLLLAVHRVPRSPFRAALLRMREGDSLSVMAPAATLPWDLWGAPPMLAGRDSGTVLAELKLGEVKELRRVRAEAREQELWSRDRELEERAAMNRYLREQGREDLKPWEGIYILSISKGKLPYVQSGELVTLEWTARFLDGKIFHDTRVSGPLTFRLGDPEQVIHGIESIVHSLGQGGRAEVLIPSNEAFGERGAAGGLVPPYTPVIYDLRVVEVVR
ncbi:MAG: FKBP-type peptidyl-prolyl cis-trans isomerase [Flavobacteriales bacterium]|nr:FKBP-type peptidyl-prolyl cis-trans isomerase [Flavobacteriales bacterium]